MVAIWIIAFLASRDSSYGTQIGFNCGIAQISIKITDLSASENTFSRITIDIYGVTSTVILPAPECMAVCPL